jgi:hypothetical protein
MLTIYDMITQARMAIVFYAEPVDPLQLPKSSPDFESLGASWCSYEDMHTLKLRGREPLIWAK